MQALIAELEAETEGSRELDDRIMAHIGALAVSHVETDGDEHFEVFESRLYTTSFEDALTWMPENCVIELCQSCPARADDTWWDAYVFKRPRGHDSEPIGATEQGVPEPALAACIAIAKAWQAMKENG